MHRIVKDPLVLTFLFAVSGGRLLGQQNLSVNKLDGNFLTTKDYYPLSPTAASLGVFGQTAVSYYSGSPIVNVPLASIKYKEVGIDLSLSYVNTGGNKPDVIPGLTGNGWLFNSGGAITIISRGISPADVGSSNSVLINPYETSPGNWKDSSTLAADMLGKKFPYDYSEKRFDEFSYNFGASTGRFYSDYPGTQAPSGIVQHIKTIQGEDLTVQKIILSYKAINLPVEVQDNSDHFLSWDSAAGGAVPDRYVNVIKQNTMTYGFIITDSRGVKYTFGNNDSAIEFTRNGLAAYTYDKINQNPTPSTWYLSSIQSPNGALIRFVYKRGIFYTFTTANVKGIVLTPSAFQGTAMYPFSVILSSTLYNPTYLDSVVTPISKTKLYWSIANQQLPYSVMHPTGVDTNNAASPYTFDPYIDVCDATNMGKRFSNKLDSFSIFTIDSLENKSIQFSYTADTTTRLKLLSVKIQGSSALDGFQKYQFQYDSLALPPYRAFKTDKYGYYDGRTPVMQITTDPNYYASFLADTSKLNPYLRSREPDSTYTKAEILRKIIYPTGGYSNFDYENNTYGGFADNWPVSLTAYTSDSLGGGLRIKSITNYDFANHFAGRKRYFYYKNYAIGGRSSSGVLNFKPKFLIAYNGTITDPQITGYFPDSRYIGASISFTQFNSDGLYPASYAKGNPINYSEVTEMNVDDSYTVFKFKNYDNGYNDNPAENLLADNPQIAPFWKEDEVNSLDIERGQMLSQSQYDTTGVIRTKTIYGYNDTITRFNSNVRMLKVFPNPAFSGNFPTLRYLAYLIYTYYPFVKKQTHFEYTTSGDSIVTVTNFSYDTIYRSLTRQTLIGSDSGQRTTINRYPPDMVALGQTTPYQAMVTSHQVAPLIETEEDLNGNILSKWITAYKKGLADDTNLILPYTLSSQFRSQSPVVRKRFERYDSLGNILILSQPGAAKTNFVWGYARSNPLAIVVNAPYDSVVAALGGSSSVNSLADQPVPFGFIFNILMRGLRNANSLKNSLITTYTFDPLTGMTSQMDPRRMTTYYAYDLLGRLSTVRNNDQEVVKQYCYDYAGQSAHCQVNSDAVSYQFYYSTDHTVICDVPNHMNSVILVTLYTIPNKIFDSTSSLMISGTLGKYFLDSQLSEGLTDGYYTAVNTLQILRGPNSFYSSGGNIFYTNICSGGVPPFSLKYTDTIRKHDICDSTYPTKYVYTVGNDTPALTKTLYSGYQLSTPVVNGYYLKNGTVYHTNNGIVDSALSCSVLFPPPISIHSFKGATSSVRSGICNFNRMFAITFYFKDTVNNVNVGDIIYINSACTHSIGAGFATDGGRVYTVNSSGAVTAIGSCP
jgi:hypothetical protein